MGDATQQVRGFEAFYELVTSGGAGQDYASRVRRTLDAFLSEPERHRELADDILQVYSALWVGSKVRATRAALQGAVEAPARRISAAPDVVQGRVESTGLAQFLGLVGQPRNVVDQPPELARDALNALLLQPERHRAHVDVIVESYAASSLASRFPASRPLLARAMRRRSRRWRAELDMLLMELRQQAAEAGAAAPIALNADFLPVAELPLPERYASDSRFRNLGVEVRIHVAPQEGFRLRALTLDVSLQDSAKVLSAGASVASDGSKSDLSITTNADHIASKESSWKVGIEAKVPLGASVSAGLERASKDASSEQHQVVANQILDRGMRLLTTAIDSTARFQLKIEDGLPTAGDGGLPLAATLSMNALVPVGDSSLDARLAFTFNAGWYDGAADYREQLEAPALSS